MLLPSSSWPWRKIQPCWPGYLIIIKDKFRAVFSFCAKDNGEHKQVSKEPLEEKTKNCLKHLKQLLFYFNSGLWSYAARSRIKDWHCLCWFILKYSALGWPGLSRFKIRDLGEFIVWWWNRGNKRNEGLGQGLNVKREESHGRQVGEELWRMISIDKIID